MWAPGARSNECRHCTHVSIDATRPSSACTHGPSSSWSSTALIPMPGAQATPASIDRPRRHVDAGAGHVDTRLQLDRRLAGPAPLHPEAVDVLEPGELEAVSHFVAEA